MLRHQPTRHDRRRSEEGSVALLRPAGADFPKQIPLIIDFNLFVAVESRDPGLLPQHADPADRLQD